MDKETGLITLQLIQSALPTQSDFDKGDEFSFDRLLDWLTQQIDHLIDYDYKHLVEALYRIDVPESKVAEILNGDVTNVSRNLAKAILERQMKKAATRIKYRDW
ncbi:MAG: hypothetical protein R8G66_15990 [Cytophagales bacterium]|nr:hypothetical protein [Cytophagales bacterium]